MKTTKSKTYYCEMLAILILVLGLVGNVSGQNSPVKFRATVASDEDHGVMSVCYGDYFVEVSINEILEDVNSVLTGITSVQVCYNDAQGLVLGDNVEVYGYYWAGICPKQLCRRVQILDGSYYIIRVRGYGDNDWMVSGSNMHSIPSGNVGIGTATPEDKLHVVGNVRVEGTSPAWLNLVGGFGEDAGVSLTTMGLGVNKWEVLREGSSGDFLIRETFPYRPFWGATLVVKAGSGNVGIGTPTPQENLHVVGNAIIEAQVGGGFGAPLRVVKGGTGRQLAAFFSNPTDGVSCEVEIQMGTGTMLPSAWSLKAASGLFSIANVAVLPPALNIRSTGEVGIGTINPQGKLDVNGSIYQRGSQLHADYVFEPGYDLESIDEHSEFMWQHKHLAAIPKAVVNGNGQQILEIGAHRKGMVEELEKAHIYIEQLHKRIKVLEEKLAKLEAQVSTL